ncbi:MAG: type IX secretion system sortase PorU [Chloroherpetonaceae bacterium]|nr:type IX secretion system sortase PorU [Chloroherpetonaceae bacterium]MDW8437146.1 type IX secretion system sortase PorU [Chloroherpetonaceae bacterium]
MSVLRKDETSLVVAFSPEWQPEDAIEISGATYRRFSFLGGASSAARVGLPDIPTFSFSILVGSSQTPRAEILSQESVWLSNVLLAPTPAFDREGNALYEFAPAYASAPSPNVVEASTPEIARGYFVSTIALRPLRYDARTKTLQKFTKLVVRISFDRFESAQAFQARFAPKADETFSHFLNYDVGKFWRVPPLRNDATDTVRQSVLRSGRFYKLELREEGVYRLDRAYLESIGINPNSVDPRKIKIYFNGGEELDSRVNAPTIPDLREQAIFVSGESDGRFDAGDFVLFYAKGAQGVRYDASQRRLTHYNNRFTNSAFAFLALDGENGRRVSSLPSAQSQSPFVPQSFQTQVFVENDRVHFANFGLDFYDAPLTSSRRSALYSFATPSVDASRPARLRSLFVLASNQGENFSIRLGGATLGQMTTFGGTVGSYVVGGTFSIDVSSFPIPSQPSLSLAVEFSGNSPIASLYPDWIEVDYWRRFEAENGFLKFNSLVGLTAERTVEYRLSGFSSSLVVWDVSSGQAISGVSPSGAFQRDESPSVYREYVAFDNSYSFKRPVSASLVANQNIRSLTAQSPEYIIVYPKEYEQAATRLFNHRRDNARWGSLALRCAMVSTEQIYNEFSGGKQDYSAIRNFVKFLYDNAPSDELRPKYVALLGDGDWDFRNLVSRAYPKVPAFASAERTNELAPYNCSDDFFVSVQGEDFRPELAIGRLTVQSAREAEFAVEKIIGYETNSDLGDWRNRLGLVADDYPNGAVRFPGHARDQFTRDSEATLREVRLSAPFIDAVKLYAPFYRPESIGGGRRFPALYNDIINQLNAGLLITNFIGHGNPNVWTAERIFEPATSLRLLNNQRRLTFCVTATCDFGRSDDPFFQSGAEQMFLAPNGGAVGLFTTSRAILVTSGSLAPPALIRQLLTRQADGLTSPVGLSFYRFKLNNAVGSDAGFFFLLGDPAMRLVSGRAIAQIDSVNGVALQGSPTFSLSALSRARLSGSIRSPQGAVVSDFNGRVATVVFDAARATPADHEGDGAIDEYYDVRNALVYRGVVEARNGRFAIQFVVPKDISYDSVNSGRISLYAWKNNHNLGDLSLTASGATEQVVFAGANPNAPRDESPPDALIYLNDRSFTSGGVTHQNPIFVAELSDENGINLTQSIGRAITLVVNGDERNPISLNDFYQAKEGSFTDGEIRYPFRNLRDGRYSLRFKAWDTFNNSVERFLDFVVQDSSRLALGSRAMNYPNPFRDRTTFVIENNRPNELIDVQIKIYAVSGRLIKTLRATQAAHRINIEWDGRDDDGDLVANGVYLYKVILSSQDGRFRAERIEKLAIAR